MVSFAFSALVAVVYSLAMYLMMDHNTKEYIEFLRILYKFKLYWCCGCFGPMIRNQYEFMTADTAKQYDGIHLSTTSKSADTQYGIHKTGMEMSVDTKTVNRSIVNP